MTEIVTSKELLAEVAVSRNQLSLWGKEGLEHAAKVSHGKWDRERALIWIADRRADSLREDGRDAPEGMDWGTISEHRARLYKLQGDGQELRNDIQRGHLVYRESAVQAFAEATQEIIAVGDGWARDVGTDAVRPLLDTLTQAQALHIKLEIWNELRDLHATAVRRIEGTLAGGVDVGPSRVRLPRRMGG